MLLGGLALVSTFRREWRSASSVRADGIVGAYVEWITRSLVEFFDPTDR